MKPDPLPANGSGVFCTDLWVVMGIAFLPAVTVAAEIAQARLAALQWKGHDFQVVTQVLWHKEKWLSPALNAFLTVTREVLKVTED